MCTKLLWLCLTFVTLRNRSPADLFVHVDSPQGENTGEGCHALLQDSSHPGTEPTPMSSALAGGFLRQHHLGSLPEGRGTNQSLWDPCLQASWAEVMGKPGFHSLHWHLKQVVTVCVNWSP